ncbi:hypothetical protein CC79DRAFT_74226 [Sarocladium strictum]
MATTPDDSYSLRHLASALYRPTVDNNGRKHLQTVDDYVDLIGLCPAADPAVPGFFRLFALVLVQVAMVLPRTRAKLQATYPQ